MENVRRSFAAGVFYEASPEALRRQLEWSFSHPLGPGSQEPPGEGARPRILLVPHGGLYYSGPAAAHAYRLLRGWSGLAVIVAPNHTGLGAGVSVGPWTSWETPLGVLQGDPEAARVIAEALGGELEPLGSMYEHSVEVQLPFLAFVSGGSRVVAVVMLDQGLGVAERVGRVLGELLRSREDAVLVATTNLVAYEPPARVREKDEKLLETIMGGDVETLYRLVEELEARVCGVGVAAAAMIAGSRLGLEPRLLSHVLSSDVAGGDDLAVGYASLAWL